MPSKSAVAPITWGAFTTLRHAALAAAFPAPQEETPAMTTVSAPAFNGLAALERANAILSAVEAGEPLELAPGELGAIRATFATLMTAAAAAAPRPAGPFVAGMAGDPAMAPAAPRRERSSRMTPRAIQPQTVVVAGKLLPKMWLKSAPAGAVFGPYIVGDTTKVGFVVRDTRTGVDHEFGRGKEYLVQATEYATDALGDLRLDLNDAALEANAEISDADLTAQVNAELAALTSVALGRIVQDGRAFVAR